MKKIITYIMIPVFVLASGCSEDILDIKSQSQYSETTYFKTAPQFNEGVVATYSTLLMNGLYSRDAYYLFDLLANDAENNVFLLGDVAQLHDYSYGPTQPQMSDLWRNLYRMIFRANLVLAKATEWQPTLQTDIDKKTQYIGEVSFLRGYAYFMLVNLWGRVPLKLEFSKATELTPRAGSVDDVWAVVETDFINAANSLPVVYGAADRGRVTKGAAIALLGKAFLYQKKYAQAESEFRKLTTAPFTYTLNANFDNQFSATNNTSVETVFDIQHKWTDWASGDQYYMFGGQEAWGGKTTHTGRAMEYGWNDWNNTFVSPALVKAFKYKDEVGDDYTDPRAHYTFYGDADSGGDTDFCHTCTKASKGGSLMAVYAPDANQPGPYTYPFGANNAIGYNWRKYEYYETKEFYAGPDSNINTQIVRYADVLLMLAESLIEQNKIGDAMPYINTVRARVGAFQYTSLGTHDNAQTILRRERQLELAGEQVRWFDLVRWGIAKQTLNGEKQLQLGKQPFEDHHVLLPIPQIEKTTNTALSTDISEDWN
ncbi:RagB/SusD family nutrient uptake outer membrane protein [Chryseolinea lacunae]|uniref:RagB/SusD family nutrient uptake outer membrane protein n=1 Tax=Chryseolinea lacunae TaxID=2801331 RepID=A0ABS1KPM4_9BACT|nr:RagB/SusD family nutrient uptake outer membrane protein [Chryseolinea lacunae]MBL0740647.1 RagB/SusD family nutrient uptake outer membrane protein [Chryseolinea lacunae]